MRFPQRPPFAGGLEAHTWMLAEGLSAHGHRVTVFGTDAPPGCEVREVTADWAPSETARADLSAVPAEVMSEHHAYLRIMRSLALREVEVDVVHNNSTHLLPVAMAPLLRVPVVTTLHTPPTPWLESALALREPDTGHVVSVSHANAAQWVPGTVDEVIGNGVDCTVWRPRDDVRPEGAAWFGRMVPEKAPHLAIDACRAAGVRLDLAGPVHDRRYFDREVATRLGDDVRYVGHLSPEGCALLVAAAEVCVVTPVWAEPFGFVVAEALACGTPVAGFASGAVPELVDDEVGRLAPSGDVPKLAAAILEAPRAGPGRLPPPRGGAVLPRDDGRPLHRGVPTVCAGFTDGPMSERRPFGFYAHHHGRGHLSRIAAICTALGPQRCTVATSHPDAVHALPPGTDLRPLQPDVPPGEAGDVTAGGALHWAPEHPVSTERTHAITSWVRDRVPAVVLVDVSVEVALTVRLTGVPVVVVRLHGDRTDAPHELAHRIAASVLAPFPAVLEHPGTPTWVRDKTTYSGFVAPAAPAPTDVDDHPGRVLVVWGQGHPPPTGPELDRAAAATPDRTWEMVGPACPGGMPRRVRHRGWVPDVGARLAPGDVVVGPPGDGLVADVARAGARFVAVCEPRPFHEHHHKAAALARVGAAVALDTWPEAADWAAVLTRADGLDPTVLPCLGTDGAAHIADHLCRVTGRRRGRAA